MLLLTTLRVVICAADSSTMMGQVGNGLAVFNNGATQSGVNRSRGASHGGNIGRAAGTFIIANSIIATNSGGANGFGAVTDGGDAGMTDGGYIGTSGADPLAIGCCDEAPGLAGLLHHILRPPQ